MKTMILIDLNSIKKNPNYGCNREQHPLRENITFEIKTNKLPDYMIYSECDKTGEVKINYNRNCELTEIQWDDLDYKECTTGIKTFKGIIIDPLLIELIQNDKNLVNSIINQNIQYCTINSFQPKYFYKYIHVEVQCSDCEKTFMSNEFKSDEYNWDDDYYSSDEVCPHCGHFDCAEIEYEDIDDALLRMKILTK